MHLRSYCQRNIPTGRVGINDLAFLAAIVLLAALALAGRFSSLVSSRMGELGLLRTMGVGRLKVALSFVVEVGVVTMAAAAAATACACLASSAIIGQLHTSFDLPGALLAPSAYGWVVCAALLFAVLLSLVALVQPMIALMRQDPRKRLPKEGCDGTVVRASDVVKEFSSVPRCAPSMA